VLDRSAELVAWAAQRLPVVREQGFPSGASAIGVEAEDGRLMGVVVFHDYQPAYGTLQVSAVAEDPRWMRARDVFALMFDYAFRHCGARKLYSVTPASNQRALRFVWGLGFKPEARLQLQLGADDAVISRLFVWEHYGEQTKTAHAA
jgi:RimJ/RimL family protein N-acetyltransferase